MRTIIACILILAVDLIFKDTNVHGCGAKYEKYSKFDEACEMQRKALMKKINVFYLIFADKKSDKIFLPAICASDRTNNATWYFIKRKPQKNNHLGYALSTRNAVPVDDTMSNVIFCSEFETKALVIKKASYKINAGSYILRTSGYHYLYFHLDYIIPCKKIDNRRPLTVAEDDNHNVILKDYEAVEEFALKYAQDIEIRLMKKSTRRDIVVPRYICEYEIKVRLFCVEYHVFLYCRYYFRIKIKMSQMEAMYGSGSHKAIRRNSLNAFQVLATWHSISGQGKATAKKAARAACKSMNFRFIEESNYFYVPVHWTFYKVIIEARRYFHEPVYEKKLSLKVSCEGYGAQKILQMTMAEEIKAVKEDASYYKDRSFMKVQKILREGEKDILLKCSKLHGSSEHSCADQDDLDIKWVSKKEKSVTYSIKSPISGRIYILPEDCALKLEVIKKKDEGTYNCYIKDAKSDSKYQEFPFTSYQLIVETPFYQIPSKEELFIAFVSVFYISLLNILLWMCISVWNNSNREKAYNQASERARIQNYDMLDEEEDLI